MRNKPTPPSLAGRPAEFVAHGPARGAVHGGTRIDQPGRSTMRPSAVVRLLIRVAERMRKLGTNLGLDLGDADVRREAT